MCSKAQSTLHQQTDTTIVFSGTKINNLHFSDYTVITEFNVVLSWFLLSCMFYVASI